jgi:DNA-binding IclR family transcriptional regulator
MAKFAPFSTSSNAERAARAMLAIGPCGAEGTSLSHLARELGETKPAVHRTLTALARYGFVEHHGRGRYRLGPAVFALAQLDGSVSDRLARWRPLLMETAARHGCTVYLLERAGMDAVVLDMHVGSAPLQALTSGVGARLPLGLGPGSTAILITLDATSRELILDRNTTAYEARGYSGAHIRAFVQDALARGYALDRALFVPECGGLALPIRDRSGHASASISVSSPASFLTEERVAVITAELQQAVDIIARAQPLPSGYSHNRKIAATERGNY